MSYLKRILNLLKLTYDEYQKALSSKISIIDNSDEIISKIEKDINEKY